MRILLLVVAATFLPASAFGRNLEPGTILVSAGLGPSFKLGGQLGGSGSTLLLMGQGEYAFTKNISAVIDANWGLLSDTHPLRLRIGGRYRLTNLELPVSPYAQVQFSWGKLFDVINSNLTVVGGRAAVGADYMLTKQVSLGGQLGLELASTLTDNDAFYGTLEMLVVASMAL